MKRYLEFTVVIGILCGVFWDDIIWWRIALALSFAWGLIAEARILDTDARNLELIEYTADAMRRADKGAGG